MINYPRKVLLATDGTEDSARATAARVALTGRAQAELHVVHVGQAATSAYGVAAEGGPLPGEPPRYAEREARRLLEWQVEEVRDAGGTVTESHLRMGRPPAEVLILCAELEADLLIVGSGRSRAVRHAVSATVRRPALGSIADTIVRSANCPMLVVHRTDAL